MSDTASCFVEPGSSSKLDPKWPWWHVTLIMLGGGMVVPVLPESKLVPGTDTVRDWLTSSPESACLAGKGACHF